MEHTLKLRELNKMTKINHYVALVMEPALDGSAISWKAGNMFLNRLLIDEEAAFETPGIFFLKSSSFWLVANHAFQQVSENKPGDPKLHFIYAGIHSNIAHGPYSEERLRQFLLKGMKKHQIKSVTMTTISMKRKNLVTHEEMEKYYLNSRLNDRFKLSSLKSVLLVAKPHLQLEPSPLVSSLSYSPESFHDDLDSFFENLRLDKIVHSFAPSYFLPKLTEDEQSLVDDKDPILGSKYVLCDCYRKTFIIIFNK